MTISVWALVSLVLTIATYVLCKRLYVRYPVFWLSPIVITPATLIAFVLLANVPMPVYQRDTHWLVWMLGPATIAFAVPIYQQRELLKKYPLTIASGVLTGVILGLGSSWMLGHLFKLPPEVAHSLLTRSVSTPFAMAASSAFGGSQDLAVLFVMVTGILGMILGEIWMRALRFRSSLAKGASYGAAAHAIGTVKAREIGYEEGVVASLTMVLAGILTTLLAPWLARFLV